jgi:hypothetical protein
VLKISEIVSNSDVADLDKDFIPSEEDGSDSSGNFKFFITMINHIILPANVSAVLALMSKCV